MVIISIANYVNYYAPKRVKVMEDFSELNDSEKQYYVSHHKFVKISDDATFDENGDLTADVYVYLKYGVNVPSVAAKIQEALKQQLAQMTDMNLKSINVHVVGLVFPEDEHNFEDDDQPLFPDQEEEAK